MRLNARVFIGLPRVDYLHHVGSSKQRHWVLSGFVNESELESTATARPIAGAGKALSSELRLGHGRQGLGVLGHRRRLLSLGSAQPEQPRCIRIPRYVIAATMTLSRPGAVVALARPSNRTRPEWPSWQWHGGTCACASLAILWHGASMSSCTLNGAPIKISWSLARASSFRMALCRPTSAGT